MRFLMFIGVLCGVCLATTAQSNAVDTVRDMTMSVDNSLFLTPATSGQVSHSFVINMVNSGQFPDIIEYGVSDSSVGAKYSMNKNSNLVGPGQTRTVTLVLSGQGSHFPYSVTFWGQIKNGPQTRQTVRLVIDTLTSTSIRTTSHEITQPTLSKRVLQRGQMKVFGTTTDASVKVFDVSGRAVKSRIVSKKR